MISFVCWSVDDDNGLGECDCGDDNVGWIFLGKEGNWISFCYVFKIEDERGLWVLKVIYKV